MLEKALELLKIINDNGFEAYLVGGFVRDYMLNRNSNDVDICTTATPKDIKGIFNDVTSSMEQYGSVHLTYKKVNFEITTYRIEQEYGNQRNPSKVIYTDKLIVDLKRRDFTMNTLCMNYKGEIVDLLNSKKDLQSRVIRAVGNADRRIIEDPLRILRAIRFATELDFNIDEELKQSILNNRNLLGNLSFFRKKQELNKIFSCPNALSGIKMLKDFKLDDYLDIDLNCNIVKTSDLIGMWAQVNPGSNYQFTSNEMDYLKAILRVVGDKRINDMELYHNGNYVCYIAAQILGIKEINIYDRYDKLPIKKSSDICITGKDIIDLLNIEDKSILKNIIKDLEEKIVKRIIPNNIDEVKKYLIDTYNVTML